MYTLQILDSGRTYLHTLGDQSISLGAADDVDVRLSEAGVAPIHARLTPHSQGLSLSAEPDTKVLVNGSPVIDVELQLGDRIELGRTLMIVGRSVARTADQDRAVGQEDVAANAIPRTPRSRRQTAPKSKMLPIVGVAVLLAGFVFMAMQSDDSSYVRGRIGDVKSYAKAGKFEAARAEITGLRREWLGAEDDRLTRLDKVEAAIKKSESVHSDLVAQVLDVNNIRTYAEWSIELQELEAAGSADQQVAAHKLRSRLRETIRRRDERVTEIAIAANAKARASRVDSTTASGADRASDVSVTATAPRNNSQPVGDVVVGSAAVVGDPAVNAEPVAREDIEAFCSDGRFVQAIALVQAGYDQASSPKVVEALQATEQSIRERASAALKALLNEVGKSEAEGRIPHAVTLLQDGRHNFPSGDAFRSLDSELQRLQEKQRADELAMKAAAASSAVAKGVDESTRLQTLESLRSHMAAVRAAEDAGDFAQKAVLLREAADGVRSRDAEFADRLVRQADESQQLARWNDAVVAAVQDGLDLVVEDRRGREIQLLRVDGRRIICRSVDGDSPLEWHDTGSQSMIALAKRIKVSTAVTLGLAALLYKNGDAGDAESVLAGIASKDQKLQSSIDAVLARGRGEAGRGHRYVLQKGEFVSLRQIELEKRSKKLLAKLDSVMRQKKAGLRDEFVATTIAAGALESEALGYAMRRQFQKILDRVEGSSVRKQVDKMVAERDRLDAARAHAKDLIFDQVTYFYPYKPPAVSGEKHAEYNRVQADVNERVAALRAVWNKSSLKFSVPKQLSADLSQSEWLATQLSKLGALPEGESIASALAPMTWARALQPGEAITVRSFCLTPEERRQRAEWRRIEAFNAATKSEVSVAVRTLLTITNEYRAMFGHRPLAGVKTACAGSQGHADEMSRLGYFSHMSPVEGRRTPGERMRLAGYSFGVSENIAMTGGAQASHNAWCTSSGHHRNLLMASHREIGIGANGRYWVQNFGSGEVHKEHPVWPSLKAK